MFDETFTGKKHAQVCRGSAATEVDVKFNIRARVDTVDRRF